MFLQGGKFKFCKFFVFNYSYPLLIESYMPTLLRISAKNMKDSYQRYMKDMHNGLFNGAIILVHIFEPNARC